MKDINVAGLAALNANHVEMRVAVEIEISDSETIRVHSGIGEETIESEIYTGVGSLGAVSEVQHKGTAKPAGISLQLSGIDPSLLADVLTLNYQGRPVRLMVVLLNTDDYSIIDTHTLFKGKLDTMNITSGAEGKVTVTAENKLTDWLRSDQSKWTQADHDRTLEVGQEDPFFKFINETVNKQFEFTPFMNWRKS